MPDFDELYDNMIAAEEFHCNEGRRGVENLCKIVAILGYDDPQYFGQFRGGSIGTLINFLEDNPGAIEVIQNWIVEQGEQVSEWKENLADYAEDEDDSDADHDCKDYDTES